MTLCQCGCGNAAPLYTKNDKRIGAVKGQPARFIKGHTGGPVAGPVREVKRCPSCTRDLPNTIEFYFRDSSRKSGGLSSRCKDCKMAESRQWKADHLEQQVAYMKEWRQKNAARFKAKIREWHKKNRSRYLKIVREWRYRNLERQQRKVRERKLRKPALYKSLSIRGKAQRRAKEAGVTSAPINYQAVFRRFGGRCIVCGDPIAFLKAHWDHITPLSKGGRDTDENVGPAHGTCNNVKGDRPLSWAKLAIKEFRRLAKGKRRQQKLFDT